MLLQPEYGQVASPNVEYIEFILKDDSPPEGIPPDLAAVAYDKEQALTNITVVERNALCIGLRRQVILYRINRPALAGSEDEQIRLATLPVKQFIKLSRSIEGFERKQQTTQTVIRMAAIPEGGTGRRRGILARLGLRKPKPEGVMP